MLSLFAGQNALAKTTMAFISQFDQATMSRLKPLFDEFAAIHDVEWEYLQASSDELVEKVLVLSAAGVTPDVLRIGTSYAPLAANGIIADLAPYIKRDQLEIDQFFQTAYRAFTWRGQQLGLPTATAVYGVYYNMDMFEQAGLTYPPSDWQADAWTYDEMASVAARLARDHNGDGIAEVFGTQWGFRDWRFWVWSAGGELANEDLTQATFATPEVIQAVDHIARLQLHTPFFIGGTFSGGTAAMGIDASWSLNNLTTTPFRIDFAVLPRLVERHSHLYPNSLMMFRASKNKELAWQFIKFATYDPRGAFLWDAAVTRLPSLRAAANPYIQLMKQLFPNAHNSLWIDGLAYGKPDRLIFSPYGHQITKLVDTEMKKVTNGQMSAMALLPQLAEQVTQLLQGK
jgi:multiple sugar transport system substrate-binding protein